MPLSRILKQFDNQFGSFIVEELVYDGRSAHVLFSGPLHAAQSGMPLDDNPRLLFDYNQQLFELAVALESKNILVLGGGTLTLSTALFKQLPDAHITAVEVNPELIKVAEEYFGYIPKSRLKVIVDDAAHFVINAKANSYDLIITDLFDNFAIPEPFLSPAFAHQLKRTLTYNGVVATNCISTINGSGATPLLQLIAAYKGVIGPLKVVKVDQRSYMSWTPQNLLVLSGKDVGQLLTGLSEVPLS